MNKKGVSTAVATIALILLTLVAASIVAQILIPFVKTSLQRSTECTPYQTHFSFDDRFSYNCRTPSGLYILSIQTNNNEGAGKVKGFQLVFKSSGNSTTFAVHENTSSGKLAPFNSSQPVVHLPEPGETRTYTYTSPELYSSVDVYTIIASGPAERICDQRTDTHTLSLCT